MPDTSRAAVANDKQDHAQKVIDMMKKTIDLIDSEPDLNFGGLPQSLAATKSVLARQARQLAIAFSLKTPEVAETPEPFE